MKRVLFLILAIGAIATFVHSGKPGIVHSSIQSPHDNLGAIRDFSQKVLQPLESKTSISDENARKIFTELTTKVAAAPASVDHTRAAQALQLIDQALGERSVYLKRALAGSAQNNLDQVPGKWHLVGDREKTINRPEVSRQERSAFWTQTVLKEWRGRCDYYRASIDALLASSPPTSPYPPNPR
jgi:hypothetical protein